MKKLDLRDVIFEVTSNFRQRWRSGLKSGGQWVGEKGDNPPARGPGLGPRQNFGKFLAEIWSVYSDFLICWHSTQVCIHWSKRKIRIYIQRHNLQIIFAPELHLLIEQLCIDICCILSDILLKVSK